MLVEIGDAVQIVASAAKLATERIRKSELQYSSPASNERALFEVIRESLSFAGFDPEEATHVGGKKFPDIIFENCGVGVEVKCHESDGRILGNSIMGSTPAKPGLRKVLLLVWNRKRRIVESFDYFECVIGAEVTHSPRFVLDVNASDEDQLFGAGPSAIGTIEEICLGVDGIDSETILARMRALALEKGDIPWWIHPGTEQDERPMAASPSLALQRYTSLDHPARLSLLTTSVILFPEILGSGTKKYDRCIAWAIATKSVVLTRDAYSANGIVEEVIPFLCKHGKSTVPRVLANALDWFRSGAVIAHEAFAYLGPGANLQKASEEFEKLVLQLDLRHIHRTFVAGPDNSCECRKITHENLRENLAIELARQIRNLRTN